MAAAVEREPRPDLERRAALRSPNAAAFSERLSRDGSINVIAECKRRSPSRGVLRVAYEPVAIARGYERAGAAAISVLTEPGFFDGSLAHLEAVRAAVTIPLLRKDFIVDEYQLLEARAAGADADPVDRRGIERSRVGEPGSAAADSDSRRWWKSTTRDECARALAVGATIIGVNNRNLRTLQVDLDASRTVAALLPAGTIGVSESGLKSSADLQAMRKLGYRAFLMGERFMIEPDPGAALGGLIGALEAAPVAGRGQGEAGAS